MTVFIDVMHTATGVRTEVPERALAFWLSRGYELVEDDGEGNSTQPFPYVRRIGDLSGNIDLATLAAALEIAGGPDDLPALVAAAVATATEDLPTVGEVLDIVGPVQEADGTPVPGYRYRVIVDPADPTEIQDIIVEAV